MQPRGGRFGPGGILRHEKPEGAAGLGEAPRAEVHLAELEQGSRANVGVVKGRDGAAVPPDGGLPTLAVGVKLRDVHLVPREQLPHLAEQALGLGEVVRLGVLPHEAGEGALGVVHGAHVALPTRGHEEPVFGHLRDVALRDHEVRVHGLALRRVVANPAAVLGERLGEALLAKLDVGEAQLGEPAPARARVLRAHRAEGLLRLGPFLVTKAHHRGLVPRLGLVGDGAVGANLPARRAARGAEARPEAEGGDEQGARAGGDGVTRGRHRRKDSRV